MKNTTLAISSSTAPQVIGDSEREELFRAISMVKAESVTKEYKEAIELVAKIYLNLSSDEFQKLIKDPKSVKNLELFLFKLASRNVKRLKLVCGLALFMTAVLGALSFIFEPLLLFSALVSAITSIWSAQRFLFDTNEDIHPAALFLSKQKAFREVVQSVSEMNAESLFQKKETENENK